MKKQLMNKALLMMMGALILAGCKKKETNPQPVASKLPAMTSQERSLLGKWSMKRSDTYEISGQDSAGHEQVTLVSSATSDSSCTLEFLSSISSVQSGYNGKGKVGDCDAKAAFLWKAKNEGELETAANNYGILYLTKDSAAFYTYYVKDILSMKDIYYYKKTN